MSDFIKYYRNSTIFLALAILAGGIVGYFTGGHTLNAGFAGAFAVLILCILEGSVSMDNAVLNATELQTMSEKHKKWFMTYGILIAVVGMRLVFPILIVSVVGWIDPISAFMVAITDPKHYSEILESSSAYVSSFGGAFLMMVAMSFFLNGEKEDHWFSWIEAPLVKFALLKETFVIGVIIATAFELAPEHRFAYVSSGVGGIALFLAVQWLKEFLKAHHPKSADATGAIVAGGFGSLVYLEILDASMSFDGVIGAFAVTTEIFIVMLGLGVGAAYVRSMTKHLVDKGTLQTLRYLEHGAQWAIAALAGLMFLKVNHHVPEAVIGLTSAAFIAGAVVHSIIENKRDAKAALAQA